MLRNAIRATARDTKSTVVTAKNDYEANSEEFSIRFREQNAQHQQNMFHIRDQYKKLSNLYTAKKEKLEGRLTADTARVDQMKAKRKLDLEGFGSDLANLKKRMVFYQNYIGKLKNLVDRDQNMDMPGANENMFGMQEDVIYENVEEE